MTVEILLEETNRPPSLTNGHEVVRIESSLHGADPGESARSYRANPTHIAVRERPQKDAVGRP